MAERTIVSRIQSRRGLKQDLPSPLRPGEFGFATDTRQLYIGADDGETYDIFNRSVKYETVINAHSLTESLANTNMIRFSVPHRRYERGNDRFLGTVYLESWFVNSPQIYGTTDGANVFVDGETNFADLQQGGAFDTNSVTVVKNGQTLVGDSSGSLTNIANSRDYYFSSGTTSADTHQISFRVAPSTTDEIAITYYNSQDIFTAISTDDDIGAGGAGTVGIRGFNREVPVWRAIERRNIQIASSTGVGYIGLSPKHTLVSTDVLHTPTSADTSFTAGALGNLFVMRNNERTALTGITSVDNSTIRVNISSDDRTVFVNRTHAYLSDISGTNSELSDRVYAIEQVNQNNVQLEVIPVSGTIFRNVQTLSVAADDTITFVANNSENIDVGDILYFIDPRNAANINNQAIGVASVTGDTIVTSAYTNVRNDLQAAHQANVTTIRFMTIKSLTNSELVVHATNHGFSDGSTVRASNNRITPAGGRTISEKTNNTFVLRTAQASLVILRGTTSSFQILPIFSTATGSGNATPMYSSDLDEATSLSGAVTTFNEQDGIPFTINFVPNTIDQVYLQEDRASSLGFRVFDDVHRTASEGLKIRPDTYTRANSTVKAKFETWLNRVRTGTNMISSLDINEIFLASRPTGVSTWSLTTNSASDEIIFDSNEEARNFVDIMNNIYYDTENADIKGLVNVKTNIEVLTVDNQENNSVDIYYDAPLSIDITQSSNNSYPVLGLDLANVNVSFVDYSMEEQNSDNDVNFNRIGTLQISGDENAEVALLQDIFTENQDGITSGNVEISASHSSGNVVININNNLAPATDVKMTFVRKRWSN